MAAENDVHRYETKLRHSPYVYVKNNTLLTFRAFVQKAANNCCYLFIVYSV